MRVSCLYRRWLAKNGFGSRAVTTRRKCTPEVAEIALVKFLHMLRAKVLVDDKPSPEMLKEKEPPTAAVDKPSFIPPLTMKAFASASGSASASGGGLAATVGMSASIAVVAIFLQPVLTLQPLRDFR